MIQTRIILCIVLSLFAATSSAQSRYALSFADYMNGEFTTIENLTIKSRTSGGKFLNGGADFKPKTGDKATDKILKKKARYIIHQDTLYVNCRGLVYQKRKLGNWYALGFRLGDDKICFIGTKTSDADATNFVAATVLFGAVGSAVVAAKQKKNNACYIIDSDSDKISVMTKNKLRTMLLEYPEYSQEYKALPEEVKESPIVIMEYLIKMNQLRRY